MLKIISNHKKVLVIIIAAAMGIFLFYGCKKAHAPEVVTVPEVTEQNLRQYFPMESKATVKDMTHQIRRAKATQAPEYHYYTVTQKEADTKAQEYSKLQKADKIVKETHETKIKDDEGKETSVIENDYYAINLERKHKIKAGAAVIDHDTYVTIGYQNRDVEYKAYYSPSAQKAGAGVEVTVAKW